jgi:hypothetical protein
MALFVSLRSPYNFIIDYSKVISLALESLSMLSMASIVGYILVLSFRPGKVTTLFYSNLLLILIIIVFKQSSQMSKLSKLRLKGFVYFLIALAIFSLLISTLLIIIMELNSGYSSPIRLEKRVLLYSIYKVVTLIDTRLSLWNFYGY